MEKVRTAAGRSDNCPGLRQRTAAGDNRDVRVAEDVLPGAELQIRNFQAIIFEREGVLLIEAVESNIVVKQESRVVGKDFLQAAGLQLNGLVWVVVDPGFADKERMADRDLAKILIHRHGVIDGTSRELSMKTNFGVDVGVKVKAQPVAHARVLLMRQWREARGWRCVGFAKDAIESQTKIAAETEWADGQHLPLEFLYAVFQR